MAVPVSISTETRWSSSIRRDTSTQPGQIDAERIRNCNCHLHSAKYVATVDQGSSTFLFTYFNGAPGWPRGVVSPNISKFEEFENAASKRNCKIYEILMCDLVYFISYVYSSIILFYEWLIYFIIYRVIRQMTWLLARIFWISRINISLRFVPNLHSKFSDPRVRSDEKTI